MEGPSMTTILASMKELYSEKWNMLYLSCELLCWSMLAHILTSDSVSRVTLSLTCPLHVWLGACEGRIADFWMAWLVHLSGIIQLYRWKTKTQHDTATCQRSIHVKLPFLIKSSCVLEFGIKPACLRHREWCTCLLRAYKCWPGIMCCNWMHLLKILWSRLVICLYWVTLTHYTW